MSHIFIRALSAAFTLGLISASPALAENRKPAAQTEMAVPVAKGRLFGVVLGPGPAWKRGQPFKGADLPEHQRYWRQLFELGHVASAGPLGDDAGLILLRAKNQTEANALIAGDPAVQARLLRGVARPYAARMMSAEVLRGK